MLLSVLGLAPELSGRRLLPIGTLYDCFLPRGLDPLLHATYSKARFILVASPSGISLAPEGGAHQSVVTPALGIEIPNLRAYEPTFAREVEWTLLEALRVIQDPEHGEAVYLRLSTKTVDQALLQPALDRLGEETLRAQVLRGGYRLIDRSSEPGYEPGANVVTLVAAGVMVPEAVEASRALAADGIHANVVALTSPRACYAEWRRQVDALVRGAAPAPMWVRELFPARGSRGRGAGGERPGRPLPRAGVAGDACWACRTCRSASTPSASRARGPISTATTASIPTPSRARLASFWRSRALRPVRGLDSLRANGL